MKIVTTLIVLAFSPARLVQALPVGAASCASATDAICGPASEHCTREMLGSGGPLSDADLTVSIDGVDLMEQAQHDFSFGEDHTITISSSTTTFRGFLIRLGDPIPETDFPPFTTEALTPIAGNDDAKVLGLCTQVFNVGGLTHTSPSDKTTVSATLRMNERAVGMPLDVTVVLVNNANLSRWYYSSFTINAVQGSAPAPTPFPTPPPQSPSSAGSLAPNMPTGPPSPSSPTPTTPAPTDAPSAAFSPRWGNSFFALICGTAVAVLGFSGV